MADPEPWSRSLCPMCGRLGDRDRAKLAQTGSVITVTHVHNGHAWNVTWLVDTPPGKA